MAWELIERLWTQGREFLGVQYPILDGAMTWISEAALVSAISNAGAFGVQESPATWCARGCTRRSSRGTKLAATSGR